MIEVYYQGDRDREVEGVRCYCIYIYTISSPNLGFKITIPGRERE